MSSIFYLLIFKVISMPNMAQTHNLKINHPMLYSLSQPGTAGGLLTSQDVILPRAVNRFSTIPIKIPMVVLAETEMSVLKFMWSKGLIAKSILKKESKIGKTHISNFKLSTKL